MLVARCEVWGYFLADYEDGGVVPTAAAVRTSHTWFSGDPLTT